MTRLRPMTPRRKPKVPYKVPTSLYRDFRQLLREQLSKDPRFKADYLAEEFESKLIDPELIGVSSRERYDRAVAKWLGREELNKVTNQRIMLADETDFLFLDGRGFPVSAVDVIDWCRSTVSSLLGEEVPWDELSGSFTGGASTSVKRGVGSIPKKYQVGTDITEDAIWHYLRLSQSVQPLPRELRVVPGNVMFTVPKTSEIDRVAAKEPELNMYCQKAVGDYFRRRLKTVGIDLNNQKVNQELARIGSIDGSLATVDLSSASDSVTKQLVIAILPFEWSSLLLDLRSPLTRIGNEWHQNEMLSSMGNAFTFELESLLFWVLTRACAFFTHTRGRISVYGDDIICPSGLHDSLGATLEFFGFSQNLKKSFWSGPFRESCGKHWYSGTEVTPFYVKEVPSTLSDWCLLLNHLREWAESIPGICDPEYWPLWSLFASIIPKPLWGSRDLARRDALVAPGIRNIARIFLKQEDRNDERERFQMGAYLHWLDATKDRDHFREHLETNQFQEDRGTEVYRRVWDDDWNLGIPVFPEEV